jgi:hypothetical protein
MDHYGFVNLGSIIWGSNHDLRTRGEDANHYITDAVYSDKM